MSCQTWSSIDNYFDAKRYAAEPEAEIGSSGVQPYGNDWDFIVDGNTMHQTSDGISNWALGQDQPTAIHPNYWMLFTNNQLQGNKVGISQQLGYYTDPGVDPGIASLGVIYRRNTITNPTVEGVALSNANWTSMGVPLNMIVFEKNITTNSHVGVDCNDQGLENQLTNTIFYRTIFDGGATALPDSRAINFASGQHPALRQNTWTNLATYAGDPPGGILEMPLRVLDVTGATPDEATLTLWNAGSAALQWSAAE